MNCLGWFLIPKYIFIKDSAVIKNPRMMRKSTTTLGKQALDVFRSNKQVSHLVAIGKVVFSLVHVKFVSSCVKTCWKHIPSLILRISKVQVSTLFLRRTFRLGFGCIETAETSRVLFVLDVTQIEDCCGGVLHKHAPDEDGMHRNRLSCCLQDCLSFRYPRGRTTPSVVESCQTIISNEQSMA